MPGPSRRPSAERECGTSFLGGRPQAHSSLGPWVMTAMEGRPVQLGPGGLALLACVRT